MKINGTVRVDGWRRMRDLEPGTVFIFEDNGEEFFMKAYDDFAIDLESGEIMNEEDEKYCELPVRGVKCHLEIDEE